VVDCEQYVEGNGKCQWFVNVYVVVDYMLASSVAVHCLLDSLLVVCIATDRSSQCR